MRYSHLLKIGCLALSCLMLAGCNTGENAELAKLREQYLKTQLPEVANSIQQVLDAQQYDPEALSNITLVGRIHGGELEPFDTDKASFALSELPEPGHNHDDPGDCPFCKHKADSAPIALVQFNDAQGIPLAVAADKLFGLSKNQDVVVSGQGKFVNDILLVDASSVSIVQDLETAIAIREEIEVEAEVVAEPDIDIDSLLPPASE